MKKTTSDSVSLQLPKRCYMVSESQVMDIEGGGFNNVEREKWELSLYIRLEQLSGAEKKQLYQEVCLYESGYRKIAKLDDSILFNLIKAGFAAKYGVSYFVSTICGLLR